jgi:hypothetical protein
MISFEFTILFKNILKTLFALCHELAVVHFEEEEASHDASTFLEVYILLA